MTLRNEPQVEIIFQKKGVEIIEYTKSGIQTTQR